MTDHKPLCNRIFPFTLDTEEDRCDCKGSKIIPDWITHKSKEPPELAPAALVGIKQNTYEGPDGIIRVGIKQNTYEVHDGIIRVPVKIARVDKFNWEPGIKYRVLRNPDGHPYVSAEGLESWARWVATDEDDAADQWGKKPYSLETEGCWLLDDVGHVANAPETHRHPGDWRDSLCAVWREES